MRKTIFILACGAMIFCSFAETSSLQSVEVDIDALNQQYELMKVNERVKTAVEVGKEGDDISPKVETLEDASIVEDSAHLYVTELMNRTSIAKEKVMRSTYSTADIMVGVFKVGSCGNYKELTIHMDCEDSRDGSYVSGNVGDTSVDSNGNVDFQFCLTESNRFYPGGVLLLDQTGGVTVNSRNILVRRHDTEDSHGSNNVFGNHHKYYYDAAISNGYTNVRNDNAILAWGFPSGVQYFPAPQFGPSGIQYGLLVMEPASTGIIYCDDEDSKNGNWAQEYEGGVFKRDLRDFVSNFGVTLNGNTTYRIGVSTDGAKFRDRNFYYNIYPRP